jgi:hypothetical protein
MITVVRTYPLTGTMSFNSDSPSRPHTCFSRKIYALFVLDGEFGSPDEQVSSDDDSQDQLVGSSRACRSLCLRTLSSRVNSRHARQPTPPMSSISSTSPAAISSPQISATLQRNSSITSIDAPPSIWTSDWVPTEGRHVGLFYAETLLENVCGAATSGVQPDDLEIRDTDVGGIAAQLKAMLNDAAEKEDFTDILSPDRSFVM